MAGGINTMHLKDLLCCVETNCRDRLYVSSSKSWELQQHPRLRHSRAGEGAVHSINYGRPAQIATRGVLAAKTLIPQEACRSLM
jgi:hypothetical protein